MSEEREISEERFLAALPDPGTQSSNHAVIILYLHQEKRKAFEAGRERVFAHERPEHGWEYPSFSDYEARRSGK